MKILNFVVLCTLLVHSNIYCQHDTFKGQEISFPSLDGLEITADLYKIDAKIETYIILCHQAGFSRGSYRPIAPKLNELGYNCLAIDQRSGNEARGVMNETSIRAIDARKGVDYKDAIQDVEAAFLYVRDELKAKKIIIWGSSYSASIAIYMGSKYPNGIDGILSFSPGEYFKINEQKIESFASGILSPVFITSAKNEKKSWIGIYDSINSKKYYFLPEKGGHHGSKALWLDKKGYEGYWEAVNAFLESL